MDTNKNRNVVSSRQKRAKILVSKYYWFDSEKLKEQSCWRKDDATGVGQGVVWNDSPFIVQYLVYGKYEQLGDIESEYKVNPSVKTGTGSVEISGFRVASKSGKQHKYSNSHAAVMPGRHSTSGLSELKMDEHKISVRVVLDELKVSFKRRCD